MKNETLVRDVAMLATRYKLQAWQKEHEYNERNLAANDPLESFRAGLACGLSIAYLTASEELVFSLRINAIHNGNGVAMPVAKNECEGAFPENAHDALCNGWTEFARENSEDGN